MAFCSNCGTYIEAGMKFCVNCGTPVAQSSAAPQPVEENVPAPEIDPIPAPAAEPAAVPVEPAVEAPAEPIAAPAAEPKVEFAPMSELEPTVAVIQEQPVYQQPVYNAPQQPYQAPVYQQAQYTAPQQPYQAPVYQQPQYTAPQQPMYGQPMYQQPQYAAQQPVYQAPAAPAPKVKKQKKASSGKKGGKALVIILCVVLALALAVGGLFLGGILPLSNAELEAYAGVYECVSAEKGKTSYEADELFEDGSQIELRGNGKGTIIMDDAESSLKWSLDGDEITITFEGSDYEGTIKNGAIVIEIEGLTYRYVNEDLQEAAYAAGAGSYKIIGVKVDGKKQDVEEYGVEEFYIILNDDGTAIIVENHGDRHVGVETTWEPGMIVIDDIECEITREDDALIIFADTGDEEIEFTLESVSNRKVPDYELDGEDDGDTGSTTGSTAGATAGATTGGTTATEVEGPADATAEAEEDRPADSTPAVEAPTEAPAPEPEEAPAGYSDMESLWYGDWYGWWQAYDVVGEELDFLIDMKWDCYATIDVYGDMLYVTMWDDDWDLGDLEFVVEDNYYASSTDGEFLGDDKSNGELFMWQAMNDFGFEDGFIIIMGDYSNPDTGESFTFEMWLRPWGVTWEDLYDMEPPYYYDWYLPMLEKGYLMPGGLYGGTNDWEIDGFTPT